MKTRLRSRMLGCIRAILITFSLILSAMVALSAPAQAADGNIRPPFNIGEQWTICRGYGYASHTGTAHYGIDLTGSGCDNTASGRDVVAPLGGTVAYYQASYGNLCINVPGGGSYTLTHINSFVTSGEVSGSQVVGTVAAPNTRGNAGVSHIHFQIWTSNGCYGDTGVPFDSAHGARICGAPDLTVSGPNAYNNGTWSGTSFVGMECGTTPPPTPTIYSYLAVSGSNGNIWSSKWPDALAGQAFSGTAIDVAISPNRLAIVDMSGNAYLKDLRSPTPTWNFLAGNVSKVAITDERIAVLGTQGGVWAANSGYILQGIASQVRSIALSSNRLIVVGTNDTAYIKVGSVTASGWQRSVGGVSSAAVSDDRFAIVNPLGDVWASEGSDINSAIQYIHSNVQQVGVGINRLVILGTTNQVFVREGSITTANWQFVAGNVSSISVASQMIAVRNSSGGVWAGISPQSLMNVANSTAGMATS